MALRVDGRHSQQADLANTVTGHLKSTDGEFDFSSEQIGHQVAKGTSRVSVLIAECDVTCLPAVHPDAISASSAPLALLGSAEVRTAGDVDHLFAAIDRIAPLRVLLPVCVVEVAALDIKWQVGV